MYFFAHEQNATLIEIFKDIQSKIIQARNVRVCYSTIIKYKKYYMYLLNKVNFV